MLGSRIYFEIKVFWLLVWLLASRAFGWMDGGSSRKGNKSNPHMHVIRSLKDSALCFHSFFTTA